MSNFIQNFSKELIFKSDRLQFYYFLFRENASLFDKPVKTPHGFYFAGNVAMAKGDFEKEETQFILDILNRFDVFVNIGANIGYYACLSLNLGKKVIVFEPIQGNLRCLYKNISLNNFTNIEIFPIALSDKIGLLEIYGHGTGASLIAKWADKTEKHKQFIPVSTLDNILGTRLKGKKVLYLIDVEGAEYSLLKGASTQLSMTPPPAWIVEIGNLHHPESKNLNFLETFEIFWNKGYRSFLAKNGSKEITRNDVRRITKKDESTREFGNYFFQY